MGFDKTCHRVDLKGVEPTAFIFQMDQSVLHTTVGKKANLCFSLLNLAQRVQNHVCKKYA